MNNEESKSREAVRCSRLFELLVIVVGSIVVVLIEVFEMRPAETKISVI
jgi:hypothetical protein